MEDYTRDHTTTRGRKTKAIINYANWETLVLVEGSDDQDNRGGISRSSKRIQKWTVPETPKKNKKLAGERPVCFYAVVTPSPLRGNQLISPDARPFWWLKIGDGRYRSAYNTHGLDNLGTQNERLHDPKVGILNHDMKHVEVRLGKGFEWELLKSKAGSCSRSEWYRIWATDSRDDEGIAQALSNLQTSFALERESEIRTMLTDILNLCECRSKEEDDKPVRDAMEKVARRMGFNYLPRADSEDISCFYIAVFPNPFKNDRLYDHINQRYCWWFKIGDGSFRKSYNTHNPDVLGAENSTFVVPRTDIINNQGELDSRRNGKALELEFLKEPVGSGSPTEWYLIWEGEQQLQRTLQELFVGFPSYDDARIHHQLSALFALCAVAPK